MRSRNELFVNNLFSRTVRVFIHRVLVIRYLKNHCVNCFHPRSALKQNKTRRAIPENLETPGNISDR